MGGLLLGPEVEPLSENVHGDAPLPLGQSPIFEGTGGWLKIGPEHHAADVPPPPSQPPILNASCRSAAVPPLPHPLTCLEPASDSPPVLCLVDALSDADVRSVPSPSIGSQSHGLGNCRPCSFFHTRCCENGDLCAFCHVCAPGERKKRLREHRISRREAHAQFGWKTSTAD